MDLLSGARRVRGYSISTQTNTETTCKSGGKGEIKAPLCFKKRDFTTGLLDICIKQESVGQERTVIN